MTQIRNNANPAPGVVENLDQRLTTQPASWSEQPTSSPSRGSGPPQAVATPVLNNLNKALQKELWALASKSDQFLKDLFESGSDRCSQQPIVETVFFTSKESRANVGSLQAEPTGVLKSLKSRCSRFFRNVHATTGYPVLWGADVMASWLFVRSPVKHALLALVSRNSYVAINAASSVIFAGAATTVFSLVLQRACKNQFNFTHDLAKNRAVQAVLLVMLTFMAIQGTAVGAPALPVFMQLCSREIWRAVGLGTVGCNTPNLKIVPLNGSAVDKAQKQENLYRLQLLSALDGAANKDYLKILEEVTRALISLEKVDNQNSKKSESRNTENILRTIGILASYANFFNIKDQSSSENSSVEADVENHFPVENFNIYCLKENLKEASDFLIDGTINETKIENLKAWIKSQVDQIYNKEDFFADSDSCGPSKNHLSESNKALISAWAFKIVTDRARHLVENKIPDLNVDSHNQIRKDRAAWSLTVAAVEFAWYAWNVPINIPYLTTASVPTNGPVSLLSSWIYPRERSIKKFQNAYIEWTNAVAGLLSELVPGFVMMSLLPMLQNWHKPQTYSLITVSGERDIYNRSNEIAKETIGKVLIDKHGFPDIDKNSEFYQFQEMVLKQKCSDYALSGAGVGQSKFFAAVKTIYKTAAVPWELALVQLRSFFPKNTAWGFKTNRDYKNAIAEVIAEGGRSASFMYARLAIYITVPAFAYRVYDLLNRAFGIAGLSEERADALANAGAATIAFMTGDPLFIYKLNYFSNIIYDSMISFDTSAGDRCSIIKSNGILGLFNRSGTSDLTKFLNWVFKTNDPYRPSISQSIKSIFPVGGSKTLQTSGILAPIGARGGLENRSGPVHLELSSFSGSSFLSRLGEPDSVRSLAPQSLMSRTPAVTPAVTSVSEITELNP